ncbi:hypothetical protein COOONC_16670 [Cooperia oncophora]
MTFNTWMSGSRVNDGLQKIAKHILLVNPDIVALQEVQHDYDIGNLTQMLGKPWVGIHHRNHPTLPDTAILTRHEFYPNSYTDTSTGIGIRILVDSLFFVNFWSVHLNYLPYGPYAAFNKMVTSKDQILAVEKLPSGREQNVKELRNNSRMTAWRRKADIIPVIVSGDFNSPSHLDWTEETRGIHNGWQIEWPATKLMEEMNFIDSFRKLHSFDQDPGFTWSTVDKWNSQYNISEPQDRIDFIFYQGREKILTI